MFILNSTMSQMTFVQFNRIEIDIFKDRRNECCAKWERKKNQFLVFFPCIFVIIIIWLFSIFLCQPFHRRTYWWWHFSIYGIYSLQQEKRCHWIFTYFSQFVVKGIVERSHLSAIAFFSFSLLLIFCCCFFFFAYCLFRLYHHDIEHDINE